METFRDAPRLQNEAEAERRTVPRNNFSRCWGTFFLSFKNSTPEQRRKLSMSQWIVLNNQMSTSRKLCKLLVWVRTCISIWASRSGALLVLCICEGSQYSDVEKTLRSTERLLRKGYRVQLEVWLQETDIEAIHPEWSRVLDLPAEIIIRLPSRKCFSNI